jgi:hypothetical protein
MPQTKIQGKFYPLKNPEWFNSINQQRLHLFGKYNELTKLPDIETTCLAFDVYVTAEEVK